jgi:hypothetical protein
MPYKIISPTGVSVTKSLSEEEVTKLKAEKYFELVPLKVKIYTGEGVCTSCEG